MNEGTLAFSLVTSLQLVADPKMAVRINLTPLRIIKMAVRINLTPFIEDQQNGSKD